MMATVLRQTLLVVAARPLARTASSTRAYTTPSQEPDPQLNGYPQLPYISRQYLPPRPWQDPLMRRNIGDTLPEQEEVLSMWGPDIPPIAPQTALRHLLVAFAGFVTFGFVVKNYMVPEPPAIRREYPYSGLVQELGGLEENKARVESLSA